MTGKAFHNHSQIEELSLSFDELRDRRLGIRRSDMPGRETPLGHSYSLALEALVADGHTVRPDPLGFLAYIKKYMADNGFALEAERISFSSPTFMVAEAKAVLGYMRDFGLRAEVCSQVMKEIVGTQWLCDPSIIKQEYPLYTAPQFHADFN